MTMELVLCIKSDRHRKMKTTKLSMLRTFCGTKDPPLKSNSAKEKKFCRHRQGDRTLALARTRTTRLHVRPSATFSIIWYAGDPAGASLNHHHASPGRLRVPVGSCT